MVNNDVERADKSPNDKEKLKELVTKQFKERVRAQNDENKKKSLEKEKKKERLEALTKNIEKLRIEEEAAKLEELAKRNGKPKKKKPRKPFQVLDENVENESNHEEDSQALRELKLNIVDQVFSHVNKKISRELKAVGFGQLKSDYLQEHRARNNQSKGKEKETPMKDSGVKIAAKDRKTPDQKSGQKVVLMSER